MGLTQSGWVLKVPPRSRSSGSAHADLHVVTMTELVITTKDKTLENTFSGRDKPCINVFYIFLNKPTLWFIHFIMYAFFTVA